MHGRESRAQRARRVSRVALGGARPPGGQGFSPRPLSACETPLARSHRRFVSALPDQSHYSHVARGPGAVTTDREVGDSWLAQRGRSPVAQPRWAAHAAGSSVATATAWPPPLDGPSSRGRPADCLRRERLGERPVPLPGEVRCLRRGAALRPGRWSPGAAQGRAGGGRGRGGRALGAYGGQGGSAGRPGPGV